jgi:hypothetical protein
MKNRSIWQIITLSGAFSAVVYLAHVVLGGILWPEYSHIVNTISELTADGAPNAPLLRVFTTVYGVLAVVFAVSLLLAFRALKVRKAAKIGAILLIIMEVASLVGYGLFPLSDSTEMNVQNIGHIAVTVIVVLTTVTCGFFIGAGLLKTESCKKLGVFMLICASVMVAAGLMSPVTLATGWPVAGLVERFNIFTLQLWIFVLSIGVFRKRLPSA